MLNTKIKSHEDNFMKKCDHCRLEFPIDEMEQNYNNEMLCKECTDEEFHRNCDQEHQEYWASQNED